MHAKFTVWRTPGRARPDVVAASKNSLIGERLTWVVGLHRLVVRIRWMTTLLPGRLQRSIEHWGNQAVGNGSGGSSGSGGSGRPRESSSGRRLLDGYLLYVGDPPLIGRDGGASPA